MDTCVCAFPQCDRDSTIRGLCDSHYAQQRRGTELRPIGGWKNQPCAGAGCDRTGTSRSPLCRNCRARHRYATQPEHRTHVLDRNRAYQNADEQRRAAAVERSRRWRAANPEKVQAMRQREKERERHRIATDPAYRDHRNAQARARRGRAGNAYRHLRNVLYLLEKQKGRCAICGDWLPEERSDVHVDHITPAIAGGTDDLDNLQLTHRRCNQSKGSS